MPNKIEWDDSGHKLIGNHEFGLDTEKLTILLRTYISTLEDSLANGSAFKVEATQAELRYLTERYTDPEQYFQLIQDWYNQATILEDNGMRAIDIALFIYLKYETDVLSSMYFVEHGLNQEFGWGYHLMQAVFAAIGLLDLMESE